MWSEQGGRSVHCDSYRNYAVYQSLQQLKADRRERHTRHSFCNCHSVDSRTGRDSQEEKSRLLSITSYLQSAGGERKALMSAGQKAVIRASVSVVCLLRQPVLELSLSDPAAQPIRGLCPGECLWPFRGILQQVWAHSQVSAFGQN